jgi:AtzE family amidohydrolase
MTASLDSAAGLAAAVAARQVTAVEVTKGALSRIAALNGAINAFTAITEERALADAAAVDAKIASGQDGGPLSGVPFAVKNLFDIEGLTTLAGSKIARELPPARKDATLVSRLKAAGAVLTGALNMDEFAFGFSTQNTHYGPTRNPHDLTRIAGGSSGGSAAAVAGGMVPISLGSDTNGSIRVPAALCGVFGFKPTYGRLSRAGTRLFAESFDHVGPFARSIKDIALVYDVLQGQDPGDPVLAPRPLESVSNVLDLGIEGLRIAVADGYFASQGHAEVFEAVENAAQGLGASKRVQLPEAGLARASAMIITAAEGAETHLSDLSSRASEFDPNTRALFLSGTALPAAWYVKAQRFRRWYAQELSRLFRDVDVILAPVTPYSAFPIGQRMMEVADSSVFAAAHLGIYTQPLSFAGLPVLAAPVAGTKPLPLGVQIIAAPWREDLVLRVAAAGEGRSILAATPTPDLSRATHHA